MPKTYISFHFRYTSINKASQKHTKSKNNMPKHLFSSPFRYKNGNSRTSERYAPLQYADFTQNSIVAIDVVHY